MLRDRGPGSANEPQVAPDAEPEVTPRTYLLIGVLILYAIFAVVDRTVIAMLIDPIRETLQISDTEVGLLMGLAYAAAYGIAGVPMGYLVDRYPRKWILFSAVILWGMAEAMCGLSTGFALLFLARAGVGIFEAPMHPSAHSIIADTVPKRRLATAMSTYSTGNLLGTGIALAVGGWIVNETLHLDHITLPLVGDVLPWQFVFIITGIPGFFLALMILPFSEPPRRHATQERPTWNELFVFIRERWQVVLTIGVVFGGMNIVNGGLIKWAPSYMSRSFEMNPGQYGILLGAIESLSALVGLLATGWVVDRWYARGRIDAHLTFYMWAIALTAPFVLAGLWADEMLWFLVAMGVAKAITVNFLGIAAAQVQIFAPPRLRGRLSALFFLLIVALLGTTFGALAPAFISEHILHDSVRLGRSMAILLAIFAPISIIAILWGRKHVIAAIRAVQG